jgi:hypothetical protein
MVHHVQSATATQESVNVDTLYANPKIESLDLLIEIFALMIAQANVTRHQTRELNKEQFQAQMGAAAHPRNAAIATLAMTLLGAAITVASAAVANNNELGTRVGNGLYRMMPNVSSRVFGSTFNVANFSKTFESGSTAVAKALYGGAEASHSFGSALSQQAQAESARLQHLYSNASEDRRREMEEAQRLLRDMSQILEQRAAATRAVMGR